MKIFGPLYRRVLHWASHRYAVRYLIVIGFIESWIFPIPTAAMLIPMILADRIKAWRLAGIASAASVAGGIFGYAIGYFLFDQIGQPIINFYDAAETYANIKIWFDRWGLWIVLVAGVSPIPYKLITIASGALSLSLAAFIVASIIGRAAQFFLIAYLLKVGGNTMHRLIEKWAEPLGWGVILCCIIGYLLWR